MRCLFISLIKIFYCVIKNGRNQGRKLFEMILQFSHLVIKDEGLIKGFSANYTFFLFINRNFILSIHSLYSEFRI